MTILDFLNLVKAELENIYEGSEANALASHLLQERLGYSFSELRMKELEVIDEELTGILVNDLTRLKKSEPVQYVLGYTWFNEMRIEVNKDVLIPRPETEELIAFIQDYPLTADANLLDIGTGSGCIALALKQAFPDATVYGVDVSEGALQVAQRNSELLQLPVKWLKWDVLNEPMPAIPLPELDIIVSNPPYICMNEFSTLHSNVTGFEPHLALFVPDDEPLLFYRYIAAFAKRQLKPGGFLWFEINREYAEHVAALLEEELFEDVRIYRDLAANDRFVSAVKG